MEFRSGYVVFLVSVVEAVDGKICVASVTAGVRENGSAMSR
jgi:hypothetical protein